MVVLALASSVGAWRGAKWSWWIICSALVLYFVGNLGSAASAILTRGLNEFDMASGVRLFRDLLMTVVFTLLLAYWTSTRVKGFFHLDKLGRIKGILLAGMGGVAVVFLTTFVLFTISMILMRQGS